MFDPSTLKTLLCDSSISRLLGKGANVIDQGASARVVSKAKRRAVVVRDRHCRGPGCDRPGSWCEVHHVIADEVGGLTVVTNLVLLCSRHHHRFHKPGWRTTMTPDGVFTVIDPNGRTRTTQPPGVGQEPLAA